MKKSLERFVNRINNGNQFIVSDIKENSKNHYSAILQQRTSNQFKRIRVHSRVGGFVIELAPTVKNRGIFQNLGKLNSLRGDNVFYPRPWLKNMVDYSDYKTFEKRVNLLVEIISADSFYLLSKEAKGLLQNN